MTITIQDDLNRAEPNIIGDTLRQIRFGDVVRGLPTALRKNTTALSAGVVAAAFVVSDQAESAPAVSILAAHARVGAGAPGALITVAYPPAGANDIAIAPNGRLVTLAADAWTDVDVTYTPDIGQVLEFTGSVVANVLTLPVALTTLGVVTLLEAEALTGTVTGFKGIAAVGAAPAATFAALNNVKSTVAFNAADAVTRARVRVLAGAAVDLTEKLASTSTN